MSARARITFYEKISIAISGVALLAAAVPAVISYLQFTERAPGLRIESGSVEFKGLSNCCVVVTGNYFVSNLSISDVVINHITLDNTQNQHHFDVDNVQNRFSIAARSTKEIKFLGYIYLDSTIRERYMIDIRKYINSTVSIDRSDPFQLIVTSYEDTIKALYLLENLDDSKTGEAGSTITLFTSGPCEPVAASWKDQLADHRPSACLNLVLSTDDGETFSNSNWRIALEGATRSPTNTGWYSGGWVPSKYRKS